MANVTNTTLALLGEEGFFHDAAELRKLGTEFTARLGAWLYPPSAGVIEALLAYQHQDYTTTDLPRSTISKENVSGAVQRWEKLIGQAVNVTQYVRLGEPFTLRVRVRITIAGTGQIVLPTVFVEWK